MSRPFTEISHEGSKKPAMFRLLLGLAMALAFSHSALGQQCSCQDGYDIKLVGSIPDFKVAGAGKGPAAFLGNLELQPEIEYGFNLSTSGEGVGCETGTVILECGLEYQTMDAEGNPSGWIQGGEIHVSIQNDLLVPPSFRVRVSSSDNGDPAPSDGSQGSSNVPAQENLPTVQTNGTPTPAGMRISIPLGQVAMGSGGTAPYRSAGVLTCGGPVSVTLAKPVNLNYNGSEEVAGRTASAWGPAITPKVTYTVPSGYPQEKHLVTPTRLFRVTGYVTDPATIATFATAPNSYVREYVRASSSETAAVTLAGSPVSWWKISSITNGVKLEQSVEGVPGQKTYAAADSSSLVVSDGNHQTSTIVAPPVSAGAPYSVLTTTSRGGVAVSKKMTSYESSGGEYRISEETEFPDPVSGPGLTTAYSYYPSTAGTNVAGKSWWVSNPDGSWVVYDYPGNGETVTYSPFASEALLNASHSDPNTLPLLPASGLSSGTARVRKNSSLSGNQYVVVLGGAKTSNGFLVRQGSSSYQLAVPNTSTDAIVDGIPLVGTDRSISYSQDIDSASANRWLAGRVILRHEENGSAEYFEYSKTGDQVTITRTTGFARFPEGAEVETVGSFYFTVVPGLSQKTISVQGPLGMVSNETLYHTGSAFSSAKLEQFYYQAGLYHRTEINGIEVHRIDRPDSTTRVEKDAQGLVTTTKFDAYGEILWTEKSAGGGVSAIRTSYETVGRTTTVKVNGVVSSVTTVDGLGRTISSQNDAGAITTYSYPNGGRDTQATLPGQVVKLDEHHLDGSPKSKSGNGQIPEFYSSGVDEAGWGFYRISSVGSSTQHSERKTTTYYDLRGKVIRVVKPSPSAGGKLIEEYYQYYKGSLLYIFKTELDASESPLSSLPTQRLQATDYSLDEAVTALGGEQFTGLDLDGNGELAFSSTDRFTKRTVSNVLVNSVVHRKTSDYHYPDSTGANPLVIETLKSLGFVKVGTDSYSSTTKVTRSSASTSRAVTTTELITPATATVVKTEDDSATSASADRQTTTVNGYVQTVAKIGGGIDETFAYDSFGRIKQYTDARNAANFSYYANFQLSEVTDQLRGTVSYSYYTQSEKNAGNIKAVTKPGGVSEETSYNDRGQLSRISGNGNYTQEYGYDSFGDRTTLTTFGTQTTLTRWTYQPGTGLMASKRFDDGNPNSKGFDYLYTPDGKPAKRTSGRGVVIDYIYDGSTRDLTNINYSGDFDLTPDIAFSNFDGLGRPRQVTEVKPGTDTHTNTQTLSYEPRSGAVTTTYASTHRWLKDVKIQQDADDALGRPSGFDVLVAGTMVSSQAYHYDVLSHLDAVSSPNLDSAISYLPGTDALQGITVTRSGNVVYSRSLAIDLLGRTVGVTNKAGASAGSLATVAAVGHGYDALGRRENASREDGTWWDYDYSTRSEVVGAVKKTASNAAVPGLSFSYSYDGIGNRTSSSSGTGSGVSTRIYTPDALNQYDSITHSGRLGILSRSDAAVTATANSGVTVDGVDQEGNLFGIRLTATNGTSGKLATTTVKRAGVTIGTVSSWVPPATLVPTNDLDGNLQTDGRWTYTWDGENRLVSMVPVATALTPGGAPNIELKFAYDWQGRRIGKTIVDKTSGSAVNTYLSYAYDQWNPVAEWKRTSLTGSLSGTALQRTHLWGPDIASSGKAEAGKVPNFQAAGGVAGLIATTHYNGASPQDHFIPSYDSNGNIIAWSDGTGSLLQRMDYDPFGNRVSVERTGTASLVAKLPDLGFSTKSQDAESGLLYYGHRYYDPSTGRWLSRDPLGESGGVNLFGFVGNCPTNQVDVLGMVKASLSLFYGIYNQSGVNPLMQHTSNNVWVPDYAVDASLSRDVDPDHTDGVYRFKGEPKHDAFITTYGIFSSSKKAVSLEYQSDIWKKKSASIKDLTDTVSDQHAPYCVHCNRWAGTVSVEQDTGYLVGSQVANILAALLAPATEIPQASAILWAGSGVMAMAPATESTQVWVSVVICADEKRAVGVLGVPQQKVEGGANEFSSLYSSYGSWIHSSPGGATGVLSGVKYDAYD